MTIADLTGSAQKLRNGWRARGLSCTTGTNGAGTIRSGTLGKSVTATTFTTADVTRAHLSHDPANSTTSVTIQRP